LKFNLEIMGLQLTLAEKKSILDSCYDTAIAVLITGDLSSFNFTANPVTNILTVTGHDFVNGVGIKVSNTGGGLPDGLDSNTTYYVVNKTLSTVQLSLTVGGSAVDVTSVGSGSHTITEQPLIETLKTHESGLMPIWVRHEVDYLSSGRQTIAWGGAVIDTINQTVSLSAIEVIFSPTASLNYRYLILVRDGLDIEFNTTGEIMAVIDDGVAVINVDGKIFNIGAISY